MRPVVVVAVAGLLASACGMEGPPRPVGVGDPVPIYGAVTLDSDSMSLADLRGQVVLLNVWATWCPPCREEIPELQSLYERHGDRGLEVVGVSVDAAGERQSVGRFVERFGVTYPIWLDPQERVASVFRTTGVPTSLLIDRQGILLWRRVGPFTADDPQLNGLLEQALEATE